MNKMENVDLNEKGRKLWLKRIFIIVMENNKQEAKNF